MKVVKIFGKASCAYCSLAKSLVESQPAKYTLEYIDIEKEEISIEKLREITGDASIRSLPQILIDGVYLEGGFDGLKKYNNSTR